MRFVQKLYYLLFVFFAVLSIGMLLYIYWVQTFGIKSQLAPKYLRLSEILAAESRSMLQNKNRGGLNTVLNDIIRENNAAGRLAYLRILDEQNKVFYSNNESEQDFPSSVPIDKDILQSLERADQHVLSRFISTNVGEVFDVSMLFTVFQEKYVLRVGYSFGNGFSLSAGLILILFTTLGVLTILFAWIVSRILIRPLEELTQEANHMARGTGGDFLASRLRDDEIGDLARSLHNLLKELNNQRKQLAEQEKLAILGKGSGRMTHTMSNLLNPLDHYFQTLHDELKKIETSPQLDHALDKIEKHIHLVQKDLKQFRTVIPDTSHREQYPISVLIEIALSRLFLPDQIAVRKEIDRSLEVWVDPEQLTDVFYNVFLNAIQAMPDGGALLIATHMQKRDIIISVRDTGIGIKKENVPKIFEFFFSTKKDGMGIGLSSAAEIVRTHGGSISVESVENQGTTFFIKLPAKRMEK